MIRTYIDTGVIIAAATGQGKLANRAFEIISDYNREYVSSIFVKLELLPQSIYRQQTIEIEFYQTFFQTVHYWVNDVNAIIPLALEEAQNHGLNALDALHIASALSIETKELITMKKLNKPVYQIHNLKIISIY